MITKINHTQISNDFIDNYMSQMTGAECKLFLAISRKTIGWHKDTDAISISQIMQLTGLSNRKVVDAVRSLEQKGFILVERPITKNGGNLTSHYTINYSYEESSQCYDKVVNKVHKASEESSQESVKTSEESSHTKEILNKYKEKGKKDKNIYPITNKRFIKPTIQQIQQYLDERNVKDFTAEYFYNYYESKGWLVGKSKMKNWKAAISTWKSRSNHKQQEDIASKLYGEYLN